MYNFTDIGLLALSLAGLVILAMIKRAASLVYRSFRKNLKQSGFDKESLSNGFESVFSLGLIRPHRSTKDETNQRIANRRSGYRRYIRADRGEGDDA